MVNYVLLEQAIQEFDLYKFLDENNIDFRLSGKNIGILLRIIFITAFKKTLGFSLEMN